MRPVITDEHLHHMARRHHATMKKLDGMREKLWNVTNRFVGTAETVVGGWVGGAIEGKTAGGTVIKIPINLGIGAILLAVGHIPDLVSPAVSTHLNNLGNGLVGSYAAASGYAFGKRWRETGKAFGGGGHPWASPYENGWQHQAEGLPPPVQGDLNETQMAAIVARMQQAAAAPAHP